MVGKKASNLGNALTALGLENQFLSNGELSNFPLVERGRIANGIIAEKLRLGRWEGVVQMMYAYKVADRMCINYPYSRFTKPIFQSI